MYHTYRAVSRSCSVVYSLLVAVVDFDFGLTVDFVNVNRTIKDFHGIIYDRMLNITAKISPSLPLP